MKKLRILFAFLAAISLFACSDAPESPGGINEGLINELSRDGSVCTFELTGFETYERNAKTNGEWIIIEDRDHCSLNKKMYFQNGEYWFKLGLNGPVEDVWSAYCKVTGEKRELYSSQKVEYDELNKELNIGSKVGRYGVIEYTKDRLVLSDDFHYIFYSDGSKGREREIGYYKRVKPVSFDSNTILYFEDQFKCYRFILSKARAQFGTSINKNEVFSGSVIFDNPIIDLDEVEKWIDEEEKAYPRTPEWDFENWPY